VQTFDIVASVVAEGKTEKGWEYVNVAIEGGVFRCGMSKAGTKVGVELRALQTLTFELSTFKEDPTVRFVRAGAVVADVPLPEALAA